MKLSLATVVLSIFIASVAGAPTIPSEGQRLAVSENPCDVNPSLCDIGTDLQVTRRGIPSSICKHLPAAVAQRLCGTATSGVLLKERDDSLSAVCHAIPQLKICKDLGTELAGRDVTLEEICHHVPELCQTTGVQLVERQGPLGSICHITPQLPICRVTGSKLEERGDSLGTICNIAPESDICRTGELPTDVHECDLLPEAARAACHQLLPTQE
ncbi:hypothetical protein AX15_004391 [Amanita polypyramis BW_CC]|nr:hypothetical protein AX15_004391 [Amanita polypyramis BW_CC]